MRIKLFLVFIFLHVAVNAQYSPPGGIYPDAVFEEKIKTARICKADWEISYPIGHIADETPLMLSFDDLSKTARNYSYTIVHCDADWRLSRLSINDYMTGFPINQIRNYEYSFNTLTNYVHYRLSIPDRKSVV